MKSKCRAKNDIFCWHAMQLVFLPPRSHWGGSGWYTVVSLFYDLCLWPHLLYLMVSSKGAWIAEWSSHSTFEHRYATPWAMSSSLGDIKCFIHDSIWFVWFDTIICLSNLSCELWNRKLKIKEIYFKKKYLMVSCEDRSPSGIMLEQMTFASWLANAVCEYPYSLNLGPYG